MLSEFHEVYYEYNQQRVNTAIWHSTQLRQLPDTRIAENVFGTTNFVAEKRKQTW